LDKQRILDEIDSALKDFERMNLTDRVDQTFIITKMCSCIERFAPLGSQYTNAMKQILANNTVGASRALFAPEPLSGVLRALREAYERGYLDRVIELIHADIFSDFVEMADYLLSEGYKDPAAVIIGSVLEEHLRQLCTKNGIPTDHAGKPKKADQMNADLASGSVYSKLDQKSITSWLDLRNRAAHGRYGEYTKDQVSLLLQSVRDFMVRVPA
jgi:hypothetical protein